MAKLVVEVVNARDLLTTDHHGSASPFVEVDFNGHRQRTQTKIRDLYPTWNEKLVFHMQNPRNLPNSSIQVILYDDHPASNQKEFLGSVQIPGASVSLLESEAAVRRYPLCKRGSFSHGRGDISLRIYTLRAQYCHGNQQPHRRLNIRKAPKVEESSDNDDNKYSGGIIDHENHTNTSSSVYFSPTLYYLRIQVVEADFDKNGLREILVKVQLGNQTRSTTTSRVHDDGNAVWNEELMFVASEENDILIVRVSNRIAPSNDELIARTVVPMNGIPQRFDSTGQLEDRWFRLYGNNEEKQGKIRLRLCLEAGYHVSDGTLSGDFQPTAKHMKKDSIGTLELIILSASGLPSMKKQRDSGTTSTDAYCVAKCGNKWVRTRTVVNSQEPCWNERYAWDLYDPTTPVTIGVFDNCDIYERKQDFKDVRHGKVIIPIQTLEANRMYTHNYQLLVVTPGGLRNNGQLQVAIRFSCIDWASMVAQYTKPKLPKMHYLMPMSVKHIDWLYYQGALAVAARFAKADPPLKGEVVAYILNIGDKLWSSRKQKANFERLMSCITAVHKWFHDICGWRKPVKTICIHFLYLVFVWYPKLVLPTFFLSLSVTGMWNYKFRPRNPPHFDVRLSRAKTTDPDHLDEEFDTFPTTLPLERVKKNYDRLRSISGRYQTMFGDIATLGEKAMAIRYYTDTRASSIFTVIALFCAVFVYMASFQVVATLLGLYLLRHPWLRSRTPSLLVNLFNRLPSKMDRMLLI